MSDNSLRLQVIFSGIDKLTAPLRGLTQSAKQLTGGMQSARGEIRKLQGQAAQVAKFRELKAGVEATRKEMAAAADKAKAMGAELAKSEAPTLKMRKEFDRARRDLDRLERKFGEQNRTLDQSRKALGDAGIKTSDLARSQRELTRQIADANKRLEDQKSKLAAIGKARERASKVTAAGGRIAGVGAAASVGVSAPALGLLQASFRQAMDNAEMQSAFDVTFGGLSARTRKWAEEQGDIMHRSTQEMQSMVMSYQDILKKQMDPAQAAEMSKQLTLLTQDLASFKNLENGVAKEKIFSGLIGEAEPLRAVGVLLSDQAVKAKAAQMGFKALKGEFTEGQKVQARAALIMEQLKDAQGDVVRTQSSAANQIRASSSAWDELKVKLGTELLPKLTPLIEQFTRMLEMFGNLPPGMQSFLVWAMLIAALIGPVLMAVGGLVSGFGALAGVAATVGIGLAPLLGWIALIVAVVAAAAYMIYQHWDELKAKFQPLIDAVMGVWNKLVNLFANSPLGGFIKGLAGVIVSVLGGVVMAVINTLVGVFTGLFTLIGGWIDFITAILNGDFAGAWEAVKTMWSGAVQVVVSLLMGIGEAVGSVAAALIDGLASAFSAVWEKAKSVFSGAGEWFRRIGVSIMEGLRNGIDAGFVWVQEKISSLAAMLPAWLRKPLGINSPSKVFIGLGGAIPEGLAVGINRGRTAPLRAVGKMAAGVGAAGALAMSPAMARPQPGASQAATAPTSITIHIHQQPGEDAEQLARRIDELLRKKERGGYVDDY